MKEFNFLKAALSILLVAGFMTTEVASFGCYSCWSNVTAECAVGPVARVPQVECNDANSCLTAIVDGVTVRGCQSSLSLPSDYPLKQSCEDEFCNFDIYPSDRQICYKCQGDKCNNPGGNSRPCLNYSPIDGCYTDVVNDTSTFRGCISDGNYTATEYTRTCNSDYCNNQPSITALQCASCNSNDTLDCIRLPDPAESCQISVTTTCTIDVLLGRNEYCYTYQQADYIERGCWLGDVGGDQGDISKCSDDQCNSNCIPQSVCYSCDSSINPFCATDLSSISPEVCLSQAVSSCFTCLGSDTVTYRGCGFNRASNETHHCETCTNNEGCNSRNIEFEFTTTTEEPPAEPLRCYQCQGTADCLKLDEDEQPQSCQNYDPNDKCIQYMSNSKMYRGCLSDDIGQNCFAESNFCLTCDTPGCNDLPLVYETDLRCIQCSSKSCDWSVAPESATLCSKVYYFQNDTCYTYRDSEGITWRGCTADLRCVINKWDCQYCSGHECNNEHFVTQRCVQCNSQDNVYCLSATSLEATECTAEVQTYETRGCYAMKKVGELTYRGCPSTVNLPANYSLMSSCDSEYCNYQIYPANRLVCTKCVGSQCNVVQTGPAGSRPCVNYLQNDECYTDVINSTYTVRGCLSDGNLTATDSTVFCNTSLCNQDNAVMNLTCTSCTSNETPECIRTQTCASNNICQINVTDTCQMEVLLGNKSDYCYTYLNGNQVERGCSIDANLTSFNITSELTTCNTDNCNNECIEPPTCYVCNSTTDENCVANLNETLSSLCGGSNLYSPCFTCLGEDSTIIRGCGNYSDSPLEQCTTCDNNQCNNQTISECYQCQNCNSVTHAQNFTTEKCISHCLTRILNTTETVRGCQTDNFDCDADDIGCIKCEGQLCNDELTPNRTIKCYQCSGSTGCAYLNETDQPNFCPNRWETHCFQYANENNTMIRGCMGTNASQTCLNNIGACQICNTDGCNDAPYLNPNNISCIQCSNSEECVWGFEASQGTPCNESIIAGELPVCFTYTPTGLFGLNNLYTQRGCTTASACLELLPFCDSCSTNDCNTMTTTWQYCQQCSNETSQDCMYGTYPSSACPGKVITYDQRGCYVTEKEGRLSRGCGSNSIAGSSQCSICTGKNCNNQLVNQCYHCSNCSDISDLQNITIAECPANCITKVNKETVTERGCQSAAFDCNSSDLYCGICEGNRCNNVTTPNSTVSCYQCLNDDSCTDVDSSLKPTLCPNFGASKCFQYMNSNESMVRGCIGTEASQECLPSNNCVICSGDNCNDIPLVRHTNGSCIQCENNKSCMWGFNETQGSPCHGYILYYEPDDQCYVGTTMDGTFRRGCRWDRFCPNYMMYCNFCNDHSCNTENQVWQDCLQCSGANFTSCEHGLEGGKRCPGTLIAFEQRGCYQMQKDGEVSRGCGPGNDGEQCSVCNKDGCNSQTSGRTTCYSCTSETDKNCVHPSGPAAVDTVSCEGKCVAKIIDEKYMVRGCESAELNCNGTASTSFCDACEGALCNSVETPMGQLACYQCNEDNPCEEINETGLTPLPCTYYDPNDKCVQYYSHSTMVRGCLSDSIGEVCQELQHQCVMCDTPGCNNLPYVRQSLMSCIKCSGNEECAWGFGADAGRQCINEVLYYQQERCYTRVGGDMNVTRGCVLDGGCNPPDQTCSTCNTTDCNTENRIWQHCIQCTSQNNYECMYGNSSVASSICPKQIQTYEDRGCYVMQQVDGQTFRGCTTTLSFDEDHELKSQCYTEYCNNMIYPTDRQRCHKCNGTNCFSIYGSATRVCVNYDPDEQCYTNVFTDTNVTRGCMSDGNVTMTSFLVTCGYDNCNNQVAISTLSCTKCDSKENRDCVRDPQSDEDCIINVLDTCSVFPLLGRNDSCYTRRDGDHVQRGCWSVDEGYELSRKNRISLEECRRDMCNNQCIPPVKCFTCDSTTNPSCANNLNQLTAEVCEDHGLSTCFSCLSPDGVISRGCGSSNLTDGCTSCEGEDGCNNFEMHYCYSCSSENDANCAQLTNLNALGSKVCSYDCITTIMGQHTIRGCADEFAACTPHDPSCETCTGDLCNNAIVPANRLECYHCNGSTPCLNITVGAEVSLPCSNFDPNDKCMAYLSKNKIIRGCLSDENRDECISVGEKCLICGTSRCNGIPLLRPPTLSCISCNYLSECAWGFSSSDGQQCINDVAFYQNESCFTYQYNDGAINRGCTLDGGCDPHNPDCKVCSSNNCNNENIVYQNCIQCSSLYSPECLMAQEESSVKRCPGNIHLFKERGCYMMRKEDIVTRGCTAQLSPSDLNGCRSGQIQDCTLCYAQGCNKLEAPSSSSHLRASILLACLIGYIVTLLSIA